MKTIEFPIYVRGIYATYTYAVDGYLYIKFQ